MLTTSMLQNSLPSEGRGLRLIPQVSKLPIPEGLPHPQEGPFPNRWWHRASAHSVPSLGWQHASAPSQPCLISLKLPANLPNHVFFQWQKGVTGGRFGAGTPGEDPGKESVSVGPGFFWNREHRCFLSHKPGSYWVALARIEARVGKDSSPSTRRVLSCVCEHNISNACLRNSYSDIKAHILYLLTEKTKTTKIK